MPIPATEQDRDLRQHVYQQAREAARQYTDVNAACPYPFDTDEGRWFKVEFAAMRAALGVAESLDFTPKAAPAGGGAAP